MSLLMEALRKAEAAKRTGQHGAASEDALATEAAAAPRGDPAVPDVFKFTTNEDLMALSARSSHEIANAPEVFNRQAEPVPLSTTTDDVLDDYLSMQKEPVQDEALQIQQTARERIKVQQQRERKAAASMFDAKAPARSETASRQRRMQVLAASLIITTTGIAGGWLYLASTNSSSGISVSSVIAANTQNRGFLGEDAAGQPAVSPAADSAAIVVATNPAPALPPSSPMVAGSAEPALETFGTETTTPTDDAGFPPAATEGQDTRPAESALTVSDPPLAAALPQPPPEPAPANTRVEIPPLLPTQPAIAEATAGTEPAVTAITLQISRSSTTPSVQPTLQAAYNKLMQGDLEGANQLYQEVLTQAANNRDGLLGLAAVQSQLGNHNDARHTYSRLLQLNPQDALARTGLLQMLVGIDPATYEQDLKELQRRFPVLAPLNFALGNLYAGSGRWHEAQEAYFNALLQARREGSVSPDYAFNLAVSLEQIGQSIVALQYYKEAESLANATKPGFDPTLLQQRLSVLEQNQ